jgi:signal transduction histidine kinase
MSVRDKIIKIILVFEISLLAICLSVGLLVHVQKIRNKSVLFLDATRNDFLVDDKRSIFQKSELVRISHDFLSVEFKSNESQKIQKMSFFEFTYELPIFSDSDNSSSEKLGSAIFKYSISPGLLNGLFSWALVSIALFFIIPYLKKVLEDVLKREMEIKNLKKITEIASQVSHDIRSPLSALSMVVGTLKEIPEEKRILIRNATQRINDIANDLLQKSHKNSPDQSSSEEKFEIASKGSDSKLAISTEFIPVIIDMLISEKRMQFREHSGLEIEVDLKDSFGSFAQINSNELKRVISNLVNNAVEAFQNHQGRITVGVRKITAANNQKVEIFVKDNGRGIPKHILEKLGQMGVTHGKEGTQSGSGLGVYHAKKTAESFGGTFEIDSVEGKGTTIRIILPLAEPPTWFANKIDLTAKKYLISLDDDISIHQIWAGRLSSLGFNNIEHLRFQSGETFKHYVNSNMNKLKESIFLVDFELLNQSLTGLDIIDELGIEKYSILVTSRYEESAIQDRASRLRLPILPKALAGFVPFELQQPKEVYDWVLLDDDDLVKMTWEFAAKEYNKSLKYFRTPEELYAYKAKLDFEQKIFIDSNLSHGIKGEDVARKLFAEGFKSLYLATGYAPDQFPAMDFIKAVVGKEPPTS